MRGKRQGRYTPSRRGGERGGADTNRWMATYGDMVTLLMAFFVLLYAMSEIDIVKFQAFVAGLAVPFGNVAGEQIVPASDGLLPDSDGLQPDFQPPAPPAPEVVTADQEVRLARAEAADEQLDEVAAALARTLEEKGLEDLVKQRREERGLVVSVATDDVLFDLGSTEIKPLGRQIIAAVAATLGDFPNPLQVEGHTDNLPLRRPGYTNWNLSTDRSVAVLSLMIERYGLPPARVSAAGYGEYRPIADNSTQSGRAQNRRVDIVVLVHEEHA